jgi:biopolymer transport protein ExbD
MWGFVSVMLVLLFMFLGETQSYPDLPGYTVDRAIAVHSTAMPGAQKEDAMQINVSRDGRLFFRNAQVALQELPDQIRQGAKNGAEKRIYLAVDARAKYGDVAVVLDQIRLAGIEKVSFLTERPYP